MRARMAKWSVARTKGKDDVDGKSEKNNKEEMIKATRRSVTRCGVAEDLCRLEDDGELQTAGLWYVEPRHS